MTLKAFAACSELPEIYTPPDAKLLLWPQIIPESLGWQLFTELYTTMLWQQDRITIYGKTLPIPRLQVWMGDPDARYQYSGLALTPQPWSQTVNSIKQQIEKICGYRFNSVLINLYRSGRDSNGWHSDDEPELGENPAIASFSLGATRRFRLRHKYRKDIQPYTFDLVSGSLLLMAGTTQKFWQHCLTKTARPVGPRINLTFRQVITCSLD